jgi:hypothetical protein
MDPDAWAENVSRTVSQSSQQSQQSQHSLQSLHSQISQQSLNPQNFPENMETGQGNYSDRDTGK